MIEKLPTQGIYTLIIFLSKEIRLNVGKLGIQRFPKGYYAYTGSALGTGASSLKNRVSRHLKKKGKRNRWHIDFLLAHENATIIAVVATQTKRKVECEMNRYIKEATEAKSSIAGFGASDCKEGCKSHLLYFGEEDIRLKIAALYAEKFESESIAIDFCLNDLDRHPKVSNSSLNKDGS